MQASTFTHAMPDGTAAFVYCWLPEHSVRAVVQIAHGWAEHAGRYAPLAEALCSAGYAVYANDHRGHGQTAKTPADLGFFAEHDGWNRCLDDLWQLTKHIANEHPGAPIIAFGHSLGSFMIQQYISEHGDVLAGAVLSGTNGKPPARAVLARVLARVERARRGPRGKSPLLQAMFFGALNKPFEPARTPFDWLSRDDAEVDTYIADPLCGFESCAQLYLDVVVALGDIASPVRQARVPKDLPIYIFHGSRDPVGRNINQLLEAYRAAGLTTLTHRIYPDGRHESLNEINRDEVIRDLTAWLDGLKLS